MTSLLLLPAAVVLAVYELLRFLGSCDGEGADEDEQLRSAGTQEFRKPGGGWRN